MVNEKYVAFIEKLIEMSKKKALKWSYLDEEPELCKGMEWAVESQNLFSILGEAINTRHYDGENSFVCCKNDTYIVLFLKANSTAPVLYVVPYTYKGIVTLKPDEYGEYITRLFNLVKSSFPHADIFIDDLLSGKN